MKTTLIVLLCCLMLFAAVNRVSPQKYIFEGIPDISLGTNTSSMPFDFSPFTAAVHKLLTSAGIFEKLFNVSFTPRQAATSFYKYADYFANQLGFLNAYPLSKIISEATEKSFSSGITSLEYFKAVADTTENYLKISGALGEANSWPVAKSYYQALLNAFNELKGRIDPQASLGAVAAAEVNFMEGTFGKLSVKNVTYIMQKFADEMNKIADSKINENISPFTNN